MFLRVFIPRYRQIEDDPLKSHYVYQIEVSTLGRYYRLEKRYSAFHSLHSEIRKSYRTPEFPPKRVRNSNPKVLEQRRQGLEHYIQFLGRMNPVPQQLLDFLEVPTQGFSPTRTDQSSYHQPVAGFVKDPFLNATTGERLPDIITQATLHLFYKE